MFIGGSAHHLSEKNLVKPVCCFWQEFERYGMLGVRIVKDFQFSRPWLIALRPKGAIFRAGHIQTERDTLKSTRSPVVEAADAEIAKTFWCSTARDRDAIEFCDRTSIRENYS